MTMSDVIRSSRCDSGQLAALAWERLRQGQIPRFLAGGTLTILAGPASLTGFAISTRADSTPGCPPLNPIAKRYGDRKTVRWRARQEVLYGLKTGKNPDRNELFRSPEPPDRLRRHRTLRRGHREAST